ncbi:MAG: hypothetical protein R3C17_15060 [Planctomycetaceae bacterium]
MDRHTLSRTTTAATKVLIWHLAQSATKPPDILRQGLSFRLAANLLDAIK